MFSGEVVERQQGVQFAGDLSHSLGELVEDVGEVPDGVDGIGSTLGEIDGMGGRFGLFVETLGESVEDVGGLVHPTSLLRTWPSNTSRRAAQNPSAPSPTVRVGALSPRSRKFRSRSAHESVDSRYPSATATSSFRPSGRTPMITRQHSRSWFPSASGRRTLNQIPSAHQYT
jgi:hypothetical protein